ncbi:MAG TPA: DUF5985 family protein [Candidatus Elarobacter sp.]|jgi:hypothetical protein|nr:DUF5985 family protein [Candidatus Elarobacter sp.]
MMTALLSGCALTLAAVASLLFFRAYRRTGDRLFVLFGIAFAVMAAERLVLAVFERPEIENPLGYVPRIIAFGTILFAVIDRNRR